MRTLVIDTATQALSLAVFDGDRLLAHDHRVVGRGHAEALLPAIAALPDGGRVDRIAVDVGPGSFTGVRIGLAAARALAFAWQADLVAYGALALVAVAGRRLQADETDIAIVMQGGHGELFWQIFDAATLAAAPPESAPVEAIAQTVRSPHHIYGSGAEALVSARGYGDATPLLPDARDFIDLPDTALLSPHPVYGRGADAKPMNMLAGA